MRSRALVTIGVVVALLVVVLAAVRAFDVNRYHGYVQDALAARLGRDVSLGRMHLTVVPPGISVENVTIGDDSAFNTGRPFAQAEALDLRVGMLALLRGRVEVRSLELRRPVLELVRNAAGRWNFATLGRPSGTESSRPGIVLDRLRIAGGQIAVTRGGGRLLYRNIDLDLSHFTSGRPFDVVLAATLPNHGAQRLSVRGNAGPLALDDIASTPFDGVAEFDAVALSGLQRYLQLRALEDSDAIITGTAALRSRGGQWSSKGSLRVEQARVRGVNLGYPITTDFDLAHDSGNDVLAIRSCVLRLGQTPISVAGTIDLQPDMPVLDVRVATSDVSAAEVAKLASAFGVAFSADVRVEGRLNADVRARGPANRPALDGSVRLRDVTISGAEIPRPVRTQAVDLSLTPDEIRSNDFTASTNGTSLAVRFTARQYTTPGPAIDASIRTTGANLGDVLHVARAWGVHAVDGVSGSGRLTLDVRAAGPLDDPALSGSGSLDGATLKVPAMAQPLQVRHAGLTFSSNAAIADNVSMTVGRTSADGRFTVRNFAAPQVDFQLAADRIDVAEMQRVFEPARTPPSSRPSRQQTGESLLLRTTGSGQLRAGSITYGQLLLDDVRASVTLDRGLIRTDPLTAGLFGGRHRGSISVDARRTPLAFIVASDLQGVDANRLATAVAGMRDVIYGSLASVIRVTFSADSASNIARTLNGTMTVKMPNGRIAHMNVLQEVGTIARFVSGQSAGGTSTSVAALSGSFKVTNGVADTHDLVATIEGGRIGASGLINLVSQGLNLRMNVVLSRDFSRLAGGTQVGGFMGTVLANQNGELVVPMLVTGTLQQPHFAPDVERIAEMKVRNLVPSLRNPQDLATAILGAMGGQPAGTTGQKGIGEIIGAITGESPQDQQNQGAEPARPPATKPPAAKPQPKPPVQQLEDALRDLLGGKKKPAPAK